MVEEKTVKRTKTHTEQTEKLLIVTCGKMGNNEMSISYKYTYCNTWTQSYEMQIHVSKCWNMYKLYGK